jgi:hypothetical protein
MACNALFPLPHACKRMQRQAGTACRASVRAEKAMQTSGGPWQGKRSKQWVQAIRKLCRRSASAAGGKPAIYPPFAALIGSLPESKAMVCWPFDPKPTCGLTLPSCSASSSNACSVENRIPVVGSAVMHCRLSPTKWGQEDTIDCHCFVESERCNPVIRHLHARMATGLSTTIPPRHRKSRDVNFAGRMHRQP